MPAGLAYEPDFISAEEEKALLAQIRKLAGVPADRLRFRPYPPKPRAKVFILDLEPRSVYVLRDEIRWRWQHGVAPTRELRYSITFRTRKA